MTGQAQRALNNWVIERAEQAYEEGSEESNLLTALCKVVARQQEIIQDLVEAHLGQMAYTPLQMAAPEPGPASQPGRGVLAGLRALAA